MLAVGCSAMPKGTESRCGAWCCGGGWWWSWRGRNRDDICSRSLLGRDGPDSTRQVAFILNSLLICALCLAKVSACVAVLLSGVMDSAWRFV